jgi:hypothetical protein
MPDSAEIAHTLTTASAFHTLRRQDIDARGVPTIQESLTRLQETKS